MKKRIFIFVGPPGCGKGTQAELLKKKLNLKHYSVGAILRREIARKTTLGQKVSTFVSTGKLVPDNIVAEVMFKKMNQNSSEIILDGFPRNLAQANLLNEYLTKKERDVFVLEINLSPKQVLERVFGRLVCECGKIYHKVFSPPKKKWFCDFCHKELKTRVDADPAVTKGRIEIYEKETKPIIKYYRLKKSKYFYHKIKGNQSIEQVFKDVLSAIKGTK